MVEKPSISKVETILKNIRNELDNLKKSHHNPEELDEFFKLYERFLRTKNAKIDWERIEPPKGKIINYDELEEYGTIQNELLSKLAVLKLNGGLGTTMGCVGPKSAIKVRDGENFIDLIVLQLRYLNETYGCNVPLVLMNSFNTEFRTKKIVQDYENIKMFNQSMFPRISAENFMPISGDQQFYPPGHGDLYFSLLKSNMLDELLNEGKEYLFISNGDNLAATVDFKILKYIAEQNLDFCMELTNKTRADVKGGTLVNYNNTLTLLEIAQVPAHKKSEFTSVRKFKIFNTNSIWINLRALKNILTEHKDKLELDIIQNKKIVGEETIIQLETALGSAIKYFHKNCGILVPRSRFLPIKTCSDLFLIQSNLYTEVNGSLVLNNQRTSSNSPIIKLLGKNFHTVDDFENSFANIPDILELDILTVSGNVTFGKNVVLKGIVIICAPEGSQINIPDGSILDDKILFGNLPITDI